MALIGQLAEGAPASVSYTCTLTLHIRFYTVSHSLLLCCTCYYCVRLLGDEQVMAAAKARNPIDPAVGVLLAQHLEKIQAVVERLDGSAAAARDQVRAEALNRRQELHAFEERIIERMSKLIQPGAVPPVTAPAPVVLDSSSTTGEVSTSEATPSGRSKINFASADASMADHDTSGCNNDTPASLTSSTALSASSHSPAVSDSSADAPFSSASLITSGEEGAEEKLDLGV